MKKTYGVIAIVAILGLIVAAYFVGVPLMEKRRLTHDVYPILAEVTMRTKDVARIATELVKRITADPGDLNLPAYSKLCDDNLERLSSLRMELLGLRGIQSHDITAAVEYTESCASVVKVSGQFWKDGDKLFAAEALYLNIPEPRHRYGKRYIEARDQLMEGYYFQGKNCTSLIEALDKLRVSALSSAKTFPGASIIDEALIVEYRKFVVADKEKYPGVEERK
jgi:hypothetical protein